MHYMLRLPPALSPIIMVQYKMANCLKGNYYWWDPFFTSMIMGGRVSLGVSLVLVGMGKNWRCLETLRGDMAIWQL